MKPPHLPQPLKVGDEIVVRVRGRITEIGPEIAMIDLLELYQQGRCDRPILLPTPIAEITAVPLKQEKLPPEVPA